jgi:hypothetical protein
MLRPKHTQLLQHQKNIYNHPTHEMLTSFLKQAFDDIKYSWNAAICFEIETESCALGHIEPEMQRKVKNIGSYAIITPLQK